MAAAYGARQPTRRRRVRGLAEGRAERRWDSTGLGTTATAVTYRHITGALRRDVANRFPGCGKDPGIHGVLSSVAADKGRPGLFVGTTDSLGERIQRLLPQAQVVKGLNTVVAEVMVDPTLSGGDPDMFIAGDDDRAKQTVTALLEDFGWPVIDMGSIESARWLEALSLAWVVYSHRTGKTRHAFKLVGK